MRWVVKKAVGREKRSRSDREQELWPSGFLIYTRMFKEVETSLDVRPPIKLTGSGPHVLETYGLFVALDVGVVVGA